MPYKFALPTTTVHLSATVPIKLKESSQSQMRKKTNLRLRSVKCHGPVTIRHRLDREIVSGRSTLLMDDEITLLQETGVVPMNGWTEHS
uniref:Uncharacterized protein n=1 Tax=Hyaloperonospora arabidopsidis (strain Emoy2) TaxID=559515 RepID=M4BSM8_HYAAE